MSDNDDSSDHLPQDPQQPGGINTSISVEDEMRKSYLEYALSVIVSRAVPDLRDGLKPVHRRILYAMHESGYVWNRSFYKSARVVGDAVGIGVLHFTLGAELGRLA